ncbi:MAG: hypothetical protein IKP50_03835 [Bacilli bacterium]|nr:hypothetical protein [Bacilli bacterium]
MLDLENYVKSALAVLKGQNANVNVQGRNKNIELYYDIWRGNPSWLKYNYKLTSGVSKEAKMKTLNMPRYICRLWANNYANEDTTLTINGENKNNRLQEILTNNNIFGRFNNFCEMFMGLGIGATVVETDIEYDKETKDIIPGDSEVRIKMIPGRRVIPITIDDGEVIECAFVSYSTGAIKLILHYLDESNKYHVATFKGKQAEQGGYNIDLENYVDIKADTIPLFQIWYPNLSEEDEVDKSIGTSIFSTAIDTFKHLDLGYTAYYKEIKLGQKIKFLSTDQVDHDKDGNPVYAFDENDESVIFIKNANDSKSQMQEFNGELRIDAITKYINTNLNCAAMLCGLGQTQFEFDGGGGRPIQTATGVIAKQTELYRNVVKQENLATGLFRKLVQAIAYVNNTFTNNTKIEIKSLNDITITYDDNIVEDTASKKQAELNEVNAGVMSIAEFRSHWYDEDLETAKKFVQNNALLIDKYTLALQSGVMTPETFVDIVYGENYKYKNELIQMIKGQYSQPKEQINTGFEDENDEPVEEEKDQEDDE